MSTSFILQEWTTMQSSVTTAFVPITQGEREWVELSPFGDLMLWLEVSQVTVSSGAAPKLRYQTSPVRDANFFSTIQTITLSASATPLFSKVLLSELPALPLARWLRWQIFDDAGISWSATFRITGQALAQGL